MTTEREIDVALALEGVPSVVAVYSLRADKSAQDGEAYDFAVELRPMRGLTLAEVHYRLLDVLPPQECGRVLFVDADARAPLPMHRAQSARCAERRERPGDDSGIDARRGDRDSPRSGARRG